MGDEPHKLLGMIASGAPPEVILYALVKHAGTGSACLPPWIIYAFLNDPSDFIISFANPAVAPSVPFDKPQCMLVATERLIAVTAPDSRGKPQHLLAFGGGAHHVAYSSDDILDRIVHASYPFSECLNTLVAVACADSAWTSYAMTLRGVGMAWLPESLVHEDLESGRLLRADCPELDIPLELRLYRSALNTRADIESVWNFFRYKHSPVLEQRLSSR
jgi:LysR family transcriptional regulator, hypochlorite-specific transcription factor HypT